MKNIFFIMPFKSDPDFENKKKILKRLSKIYGFKFHLAEDKMNYTSLDAENTVKIFNSIDYFIADLSFERPSCYFEVGYLQSKNTLIHLIAKEGTHIHQILNKDKVKFYENLEDYELLIDSILKQLTLFSEEVSMSNEVVQFLMEEAIAQGFTVYESIFGEIYLDEEKAIKQSSGAVYGIFVESATPPSPNIKSFKCCPKLYPVYWGKDISPVSRLKAHVQNHQSTGTVNLRGMREIEGKRLIFGAILVSQYQEFEMYLHRTYPPLRGTNRTGRQSQIIEVVN